MDKVKVSLGHTDYSFCLENEHIAHLINRLALPYEYKMLRYIKQTYGTDKEIIDIGAHQGNHTLYFSLFCAEKVFAFEPHEESFRILLNNVEQNGLSKKVDCFARPLMDKKDVFNLVSKQASTNLSNPCWKTVDESTDDSVEVLSLKLDDLLDDFSDIKLIKIDTEGSEPNIIRGGVKTIQEHLPVVIVEYTENKEEIDYLMCQLGYSQTKLFRDGSDRMEYTHGTQLPYQL